MAAMHSKKPTKWWKGISDTALLTTLDQWHACAYEIYGGKILRIVLDGVKKDEQRFEYFFVWLNVLSHV